MPYIECTAVADNGSGSTFAASVLVDHIALIIDVPEGMLNGVKASVRIPGLEDALLIAETRAELLERIHAALDTTA